jgi:hypothetical protein
MQPNFKSLTSSDFVNSYSHPEIYDEIRQNIPQLQVEGENYSVDERTSQEQEQEQQKQQQHQQQQQQQRIEPKVQSDTTQALPSEPRHCYHDSMSSEESVEMSTSYSRTPKLPSIDIKTEEKLRYQHPPAWKVNLIMFSLALTTFCTGWVFTHPRIYHQYYIC